MFASQGSYRKLMAKIDGVIKDVEDDLTKVTNPVQRARLEELRVRLKNRYRKVKTD